MAPTDGRFEHRRAPFREPGRRRTILQERWLLRLFEYGVVAIVVAVLLGLFLERSEEVRAEAERLAMENVVNELRTALLLTAVRADGGLIKAPKELRAGGNPMKLLDRTPGNYLGIMTDPDPNSISGGHWYYDQQEEALVYRAARSDRFQTALPGPPRARFRVMRFSPGVDPKGILPTSTGPPVEYALLPLEPYHWRR